MYVLSNLKKPFAIVENNNATMPIEKAIAEEFMLEEVGLILDENFELPVLGENIYVEYVGINENEEEVFGDVQITKVVRY